MKKPVFKSFVFSILILLIMPMFFNCNPYIKEEENVIPAPGAPPDKIAVLVDSGLYGSILEKFNRYINDVERNFPVDLFVHCTRNWESLTCEYIREFLISEYHSNGLNGALLVGQIPYALWEQSWPAGTDNYGISSIFYEDLDGSFFDTDADGRYDRHSFGLHEGPEIWVCWMRPPALNQAGHLNAFLDKTHDYYTGLTTVPQRAFAAFHEDYDNNWDTGVLAVKPPLERIYGRPNVETDGVGGDLTSDTDIEARLDGTAYEIADTWQHAFSWGHTWDNGGTFSNEAMALKKGPLMIFIYGCHSGDFHDANGGAGSNINITVAYPFGSSICQAGSGTSWSYGTEYKYMIYDALSNGDYLGKAWFTMESHVETKSFVRNRYPERIPEEECAGNNLIGNPFLVTGFTPSSQPCPKAECDPLYLSGNMGGIVPGLVITHCIEGGMQRKWVVDATGTKACFAGFVAQEGYCGPDYITIPHLWLHTDESNRAAPGTWITWKTGYAPGEEYVWLTDSSGFVARFKNPGEDSCNTVSPAGENVAYNTVHWQTSSVYGSAYGGDKAYDGVVSLESKWASNGGSAESWLALDLGKQCEITGFVVRHEGATGADSFWNTALFRIETGPSLSGPWTTAAAIDNSGQLPCSTTILPHTVTSRYVRLYIIDAGPDNVARIAEFEVYSIGSGCHYDNLLARVQIDVNHDWMQELTINPG
ncbi:MAG: discoidin domain-containing protein, partial [Spirochaetales bacterium]|nr:discoidin domain-containing protein [Spirochaetales bacterium]